MVVVPVAVAAGLFSRRRSHEDEHSVQHYHRQLHTLEGMRDHPAGSAREGAGGAGAHPVFPASAVRLAGTSTVRLTETAKPEVPPVAPSAITSPAEPVHFDDALPLTLPLPPPPLPPPPDAGPLWRQDPVMTAINHRPRRLGAPAAAVGAVIVLVVILVLTGQHSLTPAFHHKAAPGRATTVSPGPRVPTATVPALVSPPVVSSAHAATYTVGRPAFTLALAATSAPCWVEVTDVATGAVLFTGILGPGQEHTVGAPGSVSVIAGAPQALAVTVDGSAVTLPPGFQAPITLGFMAAAPPG
ncbi:MAG TPA: DUF4115 domain-containing protein [Acidimicrobiales bacterium]|nr:DUF4115 domain-containing protein [Acidimicrobiales bacterium]